MEENWENNGSLYSKRKNWSAAFQVLEGLRAYSRAGFLNLSTPDTLDWMLLCWGGVGAVCVPEGAEQHPDFHPLVARSASSLSCGHSGYLHMLPVFPRRVRGLLFENQCVRAVTKTSLEIQLDVGLMVVQVK